MKYPPLPQVIMEIILGEVSSMAENQSLSRCRGSLQCIFLSDLVTADGRYRESFVFKRGPIKQRSNYCSPRECPTKKDWDTWFNFWKNYATTGRKLKVPLGQWTHPTRSKWLWYTSLVDDLHQVENGMSTTISQPSQSRCRTRSGLGYALAWKEPLRTDHVMGQPVSVQESDTTNVYKLNTGTPLVRGPQQPRDFWEYRG
jgi:hypothetical protein